MVNIVKKIVPESRYYLKCPYEMTPTRIVVHNTANDAPARNEISYMTNNDYETSFHYAVDDKEIVQGLPENRNGWHASDGNGKGNREGIAIEICYSLSGGDRFIKAEQNTVDLIVDILNRYNWDIDKDYESDKLVFNRVLQSGSGSSIYGLEFAKSLHIDSEFLQNANNIRKRLANDFDELELLVKKKTSKYNKNLYITKCVICGAAAEDVHHMKEQALANNTGFIGDIHKDHKHNLIPLYKEHHNQIHDGKLKVDGFVMSSRGLELQYEEQLKKPKIETQKEIEINEPKEEDTNNTSASKILLDDW